MYASKASTGQSGSQQQLPSSPSPTFSSDFRFVCRHSSMIQLGCRPRNVSLLSVIILGLLNMLLTFLLLQSENCSRASLGTLVRQLSGGKRVEKEAPREGKKEGGRPANVQPGPVVWSNEPCLPSPLLSSSSSSARSQEQQQQHEEEKEKEKVEKEARLSGQEEKEEEEEEERAAVGAEEEEAAAVEEVADGVEEGGRKQRQQQQQPPGLGGLKLDVRLGRWDARRLFRTFDSVLTGSRFVELSQSSRVCLATQSSLEKLHSLVQVAYQWSGPLSLGVYVAGDEEFELLQQYLAYLGRCYAPIRERLALSLAVPAGRPPRRQPRARLPALAPELLPLDCQRPEAALAKLLAGLPGEQTSWRARNPYPQNHMRNLARKNCQSEHVFLTDVDIVPSTGLSRALEDFLGEAEQARCDKCAYVIPTFELDARARFPRNKSELVRLASKGLARPFHHKVFIHNQFATNFTRWMLDPSPGDKNQENLRTGKAYVSHEVTNFEFLYEPFYVAKDTAPAHDERFMGYGYTRNTQVYEMYVAGYKFKVLSPTFTVHWGLQTRKSRPAWRERQNSINRKHFEVFKKEVFARYMRDPLKMLKNPN